MFGRKGAFQLSMGLVVVIIFSIVLLGLGISWITGTVGNVETLTDQVTDTAKDNLLNDLASGDKKVGITAPGLSTWKPGSSGSFALGVKNDDTINSKVFYVVMELYQAPVPVEQVRDKIKITPDKFTIRVDPLGADTKSIVIDFTEKKLTEIPEGVYTFSVTVCKEEENGVGVRDLDACPSQHDLDDNAALWDDVYGTTTLNLEIRP